MEASDLTAEDLQHAAACATKYRGLGIDDDDLEQEAYLAVCEAAKAFRPDEHPGVPFWGYAHRRVDLALKAAIGRCRDHDESCFDREPSTGPDPHAQKLENELWAAIETLPDPSTTPSSWPH